MLQISGKVLDVTSEIVQGPRGAFESKEIHVLAGLQVEALRVGQDFPASDLPKKDETVTLNVVVSAFGRKNGGAGYRLTALSRVHGKAPAHAAHG